MNDTVNKENESEKKGFRFRFLYAVLFVMFVELIVAGVLGYNIIKMDILPGKYLIAIVIAIVIFNLLLLLSSKKIWTGIIMIILACFLSAGMLYGLDAVVTVDKTITNITNNAEEKITEMAIVVLKDSGVHEITGLQQFIVSYVNDSDYEHARKVMDEIDAAVGGEVNYDEFSDNMAMIDALYAKTVDAMIMNKAYIDMVVEIPGYEDFADRINIIYSNEIVSYMDVVDEKETNLDSFIVYISGIDKFGAVTATSRSDVNILAVVNTKTKKVVLINTPRDYYVQLPNSGQAKDMLTHAGLYGVDCSIGALENLYDIDINYFVRMNFSGFESIIDSLGGIDVYSEYDFTVEPIKHYTVGMNHLTGLEALAFARERKSFAAGDVQRGKNQMAVITAMIDKMTSSEILYNYSSVLESISESFQTNMSGESIYKLVRQQIEDGRGWTVENYTATGQGQYNVTYSMPGRELYVMVPDDEAVQNVKELVEATLNER